MTRRAPRFALALLAAGAMGAAPDVVSDSAWEARARELAPADWDMDALFAAIRKAWAEGETWATEEGARVPVGGRAGSPVFLRFAGPTTRSVERWTGYHMRGLPLPGRSPKALFPAPRRPLECHPDAVVGAPENSVWRQMWRAVERGGAPPPLGSRPKAMNSALARTREQALTAAGTDDPWGAARRTARALREGASWRHRRLWEFDGAPCRHLDVGEGVQVVRWASGLAERLLRRSDVRFLAGRIDDLARRAEGRLRGLVDPVVESLREEATLRVVPAPPLRIRGRAPGAGAGPAAGAGPGRGFLGWLKSVVRDRTGRRLDDGTLTDPDRLRVVTRARHLIAAWSLRPGDRPRCPSCVFSPTPAQVIDYVCGPALFGERCACHAVLPARIHALRARCRLLRVAVSVRCFEFMHGTVPTTLEDLKPTIRTDIPHDLRNGRRPAWSVDDTHWTLAFDPPVEGSVPDCDRDFLVLRMRRLDRMEEGER